MPDATLMPQEPHASDANWFLDELRKHQAYHYFLSLGQLDATPLESLCVRLRAHAAIPCRVAWRTGAPIAARGARRPA